MNVLSSGHEKRYIDLNEWGRSDSYFLEAKDIIFLQSEVNKTENSRIALIPTGSGMILEAQNWVGAIRLPSGKIIRIEPKFEFNFFKMIAYVLDIQSLEFPKGEVNAKPGTVLIDLIAKLFIERYQEVEKRGIIRRYTTQEETIGLVRGKILFLQQLKTDFSSAHLTHCCFDELSSDVTENKILLLSAFILKNLVQSEELRKDLFEMSLNLVTLGVSLCNVIPPEVEAIVFSRLNAYYEPILRLCKFIIENTWIEELWEEENLPVTSFLLDMNSLFEDFVTKLLQESLQEYEVESQKSLRNNLVTKLNGISNLALTQDRIREVTIRPDVIIRKQNKTKIIVDAKYKSDFSDNDVYQAIAYSIALEAPTLLVLPESRNPIFGCYEVARVPISKVFVLTINLNSPARTLKDYIDCMKAEFSEKITLMVNAASYVP